MIVIMKFLTEHNKQVILEMMSYLMFTTHLTHAVYLVFCTLAVFAKSFFTDLG